ncbi:MAG: TraR/DksA family transcriptional regulator [Acidobacteriota bacterium]
MKVGDYKRILLAKEAELRKGQPSKAEIAIEPIAEVFDEIQRTAERELALAAMTRNWQTTSLLKEALARIDNGTFGNCTECEEPISERRLNALPWAKLCIRCQEAEDSKSTIFQESPLRTAA